MTTSLTRVFFAHMCTSIWVFMCLYGCNEYNTLFQHSNILECGRPMINIRKKKLNTTGGLSTSSLRGWATDLPWFIGQKVGDWSSQWSGVPFRPSLLVWGEVGRHASISASTLDITWMVFNLNMFPLPSQTTFIIYSDEL